MPALSANVVTEQRSLRNSDNIAVARDPSITLLGPGSGGDTERPHRSLLGRPAGHSSVCHCFAGYNAGFLAVLVHKTIPA